MALYLYLCETCGCQQDHEIPMGKPKGDRPCKTDGCNGMARRVFCTYGMNWKDVQGHEIRPPSKPWNWEDGRAVEIPEFKRRNPGAGNVGSNPSGR